MQFTMRGRPLTWVWDEIKLRDKYPDSEVTDNGFSPVKLSSCTGKTVVIVLAPTPERPVCDPENEPDHEAMQQAVNRRHAG